MVRRAASAWLRPSSERLLFGAEEAGSGGGERHPEGRRLAVTRWIGRTSRPGSSRRGEGNEREVLGLFAGPVGAARRGVRRGSRARSRSGGGRRRCRASPARSGAERLDRARVVDPRGARAAGRASSVEFGYGFGRRGALKHELSMAVVVAVDQEDGARVGPDGAQQAKAVLLRGAERLLVRQHDPLVPRLQPQAGEEQAAAIGNAVPLELLVVEVERRLVVPAKEMSRRANCAASARARSYREPLLVLRQLDVDSVVRGALMQRALLVGRDDVEGRARWRWRGRDWGRI